MELSAVSTRLLILSFFFISPLIIFCFSLLLSTHPHAIHIQTPTPPDYPHYHHHRLIHFLFLFIDNFPKYSNVSSSGSPQAPEDINTLHTSHVFLFFVQINLSFWLCWTNDSSLGIHLFLSRITGYNAAHSGSRPLQRMWRDRRVNVNPSVFAPGSPGLRCGNSRFSSRNENLSLK